MRTNSGARALEATTLSSTTGVVRAEVTVHFDGQNLLGELVRPAP